MQDSEFDLFGVDSFYLSPLQLDKEGKLNNADKPNMKAVQQVLTKNNILKQKGVQNQELQHQQKIISLQNIIRQNMHLNFPNVDEKGLTNPYQQTNNVSKSQIQDQFLMPQQQKILEMKRNVSTKSLKSLKDCNLQEIKGNVKNAYIKKITSLLSLNEQEQQLIAHNEKQQAEIVDEDESSSSQLSKEQDQSKIMRRLKLRGILMSSQDLANNEQKTQRMKESAKNSRLRKKVYISLLEKKVVELQSQIEFYQQETVQKMTFVKKILQTNDSMNSLVVDQADLLEQIATHNSKQTECKVELSILLDSYQMRFGVSGVKRKEYIKFCYLNIGKQLLEASYKIILLGIESKNASYDEQFNEFIKQFKDMSGVTDENQIYKILSIVHRMMSHRKNQINLIRQLKRDFNQFRLNQVKVDDSINEIAQILTPQKYSLVLQYAQKPIPKDFEDEVEQELQKKICL